MNSQGRDWLFFFAMAVLSLVLDNVGTQEVVVDPENDWHFPMTTSLEGTFPSVQMVGAELRTVSSFILLAHLSECAGWISCLIQVKSEEKILIRSWDSDWLNLDMTLAGNQNTRFFAFHTVVIVKFSWDMLGVLKEERLHWTNRNVMDFVALLSSSNYAIRYRTLFRNC